LSRPRTSLAGGRAKVPVAHAGLDAASAELAAQVLSSHFCASALPTLLVAHAMFGPHSELHNVESTRCPAGIQAASRLACVCTPSS
jgi:hypothetical protein